MLKSDELRINFSRSPVAARLLARFDVKTKINLISLSPPPKPFDFTTVARRIPAYEILR